MMETHPYARQMQSEFIRDVERTQPRYAVMVNVATSWLRSPDSDTAVLKWWNEYAAANYELTGVADIFPQGTTYKWDGEAAAYRPRSEANVLVYRRR